MARSCYQQPPICTEQGKFKKSFVTYTRTKALLKSANPSIPIISTVCTENILFSLIIPSQVCSVLCDGDVSRHVQLPFKQFQLYNFPAFKMNRPRSKY